MTQSKADLTDFPQLGGPSNTVIAQYLLYRTLFLNSFCSSSLLKKGSTLGGGNIFGLGAQKKFLTPSKKAPCTTIDHARRVHFFARDGRKGDPSRVLREGIESGLALIWAASILFNA